MRKILFLLACVGLAGSLWAADPIIGTWKLNIAKSKIQPSATAPKEATDVYKEAGADQMEFTRTGTQTDGAAIYSKWSWPREGGIAKRLAPEPLPESISYIELLMDPGYWYVTILENGKQSTVMQKIISKDGKTMRLTLKRKDAQGKKVEELHVFEKQ
ncbi:MAG: hypothetical protein JXA73_23525 [Acidobacteria bacterium]|nr:hypothetical protein [Acidobacteriota bacterium]